MPTTVHELLVKAGEAMFGQSWQSDLGRALKVDRRTISRWSLAKQTPRPGVMIEARELVRNRMAQLAAIDQAITEWLK